jgi:hypothetical protein
LRLEVQKMKVGSRYIENQAREHKFPKDGIFDNIPT